MSESEDGTEKVEVTVSGPDGYTVTVEIGVGAVTRQIRRLERRNPEEVGKNGFGAFELSKFAQVRVEPTEEKWTELAERITGTNE